MSEITADPIEQVQRKSLEELEREHWEVQDKERLLRALVREKRAIQRRDMRLKERGVADVLEEPGSFPESLG
jgi:hypothetical protein